MPLTNLRNGLYLVRQHTGSKGFDHYGVLDVGNRMRLRRVESWRPVVIHQTPPSIRVDLYEGTGEWEVLGSVREEAGAIARITQALQNPAYDLFGNNCEHFARFVATARRESTQLQVVGVLLLLGLLGVLAIRSTT
jgi:hypothetical protein